MKRTWMTLIFAAAAASATASAQELIANIPFDFTAAGKHMAAGQYRVSALQGGPSGVALRGATNQTRALLVAATTNGDQAGAPRIVFHCQSGTCAIAQVISPTKSTTYVTPRTRSGEKERVVAVRLKSTTTAD